jgi:N-acetylglutamate synthase-like GNAT family acetyltransferase
MPHAIEVHRNGLTISTDPRRLNLDTMCDFLAQSYWAQARSRKTIKRSLRHSLIFAVYDQEHQVAMARLVTDYATFAWLCDVFVQPDYRGRGIGKWLMETVQAHPDLLGLKRWMLATRDAHGLYAQYGFTPLHNPERWMEKVDPDAR